MIRNSGCTLVLGIDEAGRGPALGAMVLAAVALKPAQSRRLTCAGVADSKSFGAGPAAAAERRRLCGLIADTATWLAIEVCDVDIVDEYVTRGGLNVLERERADALIRRAPPCRRIIADGRTLFAALGEHHANLVATDRGETFHVAVAAASIVAKVRRDELYGCIASRYQHDFGVVGGAGYVNAATRRFTRSFLRRNGFLPPEARRSWPWPGRPKQLRV